MSRTRKADSNDPVSFEKYMSSQQYVDLRGIDGTAVTAKAAIQPDAAIRELLFFVQALSHRLGGLPGVAREFIRAFRHRLGTETMRKINVKPGHKLPAALASEVLSQLGVLNFRMSGGEFEFEDPAPDQRTADYAFSVCEQRAAQKLPGLLVELCINPAVEVERKALALDCFQDAFSALIDFKARFGSASKEAIAETQVCRTVTRALDRALKHRKMVVLEGEPGIGKTKAASAWCDAHLGEARFVSLRGSVNKTSIFRAIGRALGIPTGNTLQAARIQARIEDMLDKSKLMLVIDEAHFLWGQGERLRVRPEMVDWIDTALCNQGVPVALVATPQFTVRLHQVERQTQWQSAQFRRRIKDYVPLPAKVPKEDVEAVAGKLFPDCERAGIRFVTAQAILSKQPPLSWLAYLAEDAQEIAATHGRTAPTFGDLEQTIKEVRTPSDLAQATAFDSAKHTARRRSREMPADRQPEEPSEEQPQPRMEFAAL